MTDLAAELTGYLEDVDSTRPTRVVQERRADLAGLTRRYGDSVDDVLAWGKDAAATLTDLLGADDRVHELDAETARLRRELAGLAAALSDGAAVAAADRLRGAGHRRAGAPRHGRGRRHRGGQLSRDDA